MASNQVFQQISALRPGRSTFDLSYDKIMTADMGFLYPVMIKEAIPGDRFKLSTHVMGRMNPTIKPLLHEINIYQHTFFVAYRNLMQNDDFRKYLTGGDDGKDDTVVLPTWPDESVDYGTLGDYLEIPPGLNPGTADLKPHAFPLMAFNNIYNEYYRNINFIEEVDLFDTSMKKRCWERDYFTSSLPFQQRGTPPSLPIAGTTQAIWPQSQFITTNESLETPYAEFSTNNIVIPPLGTPATGANDTLKITKERLDNNTVDLAANTFNIADLRLAFQIQKWMERNARAGTRYTEYIKAHFGPGVAPRDDRLDRPEYIGGNKTPLIINPIRQTTPTGIVPDVTPQGNLVGEGVSVDNGFIGSYLVREYGIIMTIMSIMPRSAYQQGVDRSWIKETRYDFYTPEFANLSEQAVWPAEIYADGTAADRGPIPFGYQGRWDELRTSKNQTAGLMRSGAPTSLDYWHLARDFGATRPILNQSFIECTPDKDRIFAVPDEPGFVMHVGNRIVASRPLPYASNPGLIDHH